MSSSASFSRLFSADSRPKKSRWVRKERLLIALSDLAKLWAIESVHRPFLRRAKIAHLTRCQTEKAKDSFYSPYYNEASSMCMAHPIWSRDGRISTTDFTMRREIFSSPKGARRSRFEIINYVAHAAVNRRAGGSTLWDESFDFLCFRVPDDGRRRWLFLFRVKIPLIMRALNMRKMSNMKLADESEMCNGEHDEKKLRRRRRRAMNNLRWQEWTASLRKRPTRFIIQFAQSATSNCKRICFVFCKWNIINESACLKLAERESFRCRFEFFCELNALHISSGYCDTIKIPSA